MYSTATVKNPVSNSLFNECFWRDFVVFVEVSEDDPRLLVVPPVLLQAPNCPILNVQSINTDASTPAVFAWPNKTESSSLSRKAGEPANFLAAPAPDFFFNRLQLRLQGAKKTAPATDYWLSLAKYPFLPN